jgi:hypothetical protein
MKSRPRELTWAAFFLIATALSFPIQIMMLYGHRPNEFLAIATKLAPLNWAVMALCLLSSGLILRASRWAVVSFVPLVLTVAWNNWLVGTANLDYSPWTTHWATLGFVACLLPVAGVRVRKLIRAPEDRWWLTPTRFRVEIPIRIKLMSKGGAEFYAKTFDLSEGGAFIPGLQGARFRNLVGTQCYVSMTLRGYRILQCRAEVVRWGEGGGDYPAGVALRFLGHSAADRRMLAEFFITLPREKAADRERPAIPSSKSKAA